MIRKCFKLNTCFVEVLRNSAALHSIDQKCIIKNPNRPSSVISLIHNYIPANRKISTSSITRSVAIPKLRSDQLERGDAESYKSDDNEAVTSETPVKTELFEVKGPDDSAFLIEVQTKDLEEMKKELVTLKGEYFRLDKTVIERFTIKCILRVDTPFRLNSVSDQVRLSKIHAITSRCDEVYSGEGKFFFVSSVDRTTRAKKILQKFGYNILETLYRFQPREKVNLDDDARDICHQFLEAVEKLPKVISVTHNLQLCK